MKFFGREVSDTGCEMLIKVGSRFADPSHPNHMTSWRDGQIGQIRPLGYHTGTQLGYCCALLRFPNINYTTIGGRLEENWKKQPVILTPWDKSNHAVNKNGKYEFEVIKGTEFKRTRKHRDWFIDFEALRQSGFITLGEKEDIYNFDKKSIITISPTFNLEDILKHEEMHKRLDSSKLLQHASITSGTHSIGSGLDYDDFAAFELAIGATLTGDLTAEGNGEETIISAGVTFDVNTATYLLKVTAKPGDEHDGSAYGNGARVQMGTSDFFMVDGITMNNFEISNLALAADGTNDHGIRFEEGGIGGGNLLLADRLLIKGSATSFTGVRIDKDADNVRVQNCIMYDIGDGAAEGGIVAELYYNTNVCEFSNNTIINCYYGINNFTVDVDPVIALKNNLVQASGGADYADAASIWSSNGYNVSEDSSGPDAAYDDTDVYTSSVFKDYAVDDFRLDSAGNATNLAILDDGEDLSGTFTYDIQGQTRSTWYIGASEILSGEVGYAFGEQNPTEETAESWATWSDGAAGSPEVVGDADWGQLKLEVSEIGHSAVKDLGSVKNRMIVMTKDKYGGSGYGVGKIHIRGQSTTFTQDAGTPSWEEYTAPVKKDWRYIQAKLEYSA